MPRSILAHFPRMALALVLAAGASVALPGSPVAAAEGDEDKKEKPKLKAMALVKVEIKLESGDVIKNAGKLMEWGESDTVLIDHEGTTHTVHVEPRKDDSGKTLTIKISYSRGSEAILAPYTYETKPKKREIIQSDDGLALAITVTPKKVKPDSKPKRDDSIEGPEDPDDPLGGLK